MSKFLYARFDVSDDAGDAFHYACEISNLDDVEYVNVFAHRDEMDGATVNDVADLKSLPIGTLLVDVHDLPLVIVSSEVVAGFHDGEWKFFDHDEIAGVYNGGEGQWFPMRIGGGLQ